MAIVLSISFLCSIYSQYQCFIRAINYTGRHLPPGTKVTLKDSFAIHISAERPIRASYYACPAADALFSINNNFVISGVFVHRAGKARIDTPGLDAVATFDRERNRHIPLYMHTRQRTWSLSPKCLDYVPGSRVLYLAVDFTQSTANASLFFNVQSSHAQARASDGNR